MTKMKVFEVPEPVLRQKAEIVEKIDDEIVRILDDMLETMYATNGVGLAGNQVGLLKRLVVIDCAGQDEEPDILQMVNPEIIERSEEKGCRNEGCLSVPREYADVERHKEVTVRYLDKKGKIQTRKASGLLAVAIQHELDHLEGILFIDYLSSLKRNKLLKHLEKRRKKEAKEQEAE